MNEYALDKFKTDCQTMRFVSNIVVPRTQRMTMQSGDTVG
jgi:hypothetical protein